MSWKGVNRPLFAHELGHYLGLGHTFPGWSDTGTDTHAEAAARIAQAGGKASALDGDSLSDTPAEAGTAYYMTKGWKMCSGPASYTISGKGSKPFYDLVTKPRDEVVAVEPPAPLIPRVDSADQSKAPRTAAPRPKPPLRIPPPPPAARPGPRPNR
jgi:hypothetical protein